MKKLIILIAFIFVGISGVSEIQAYQHGVSGYFYNGLSPYGSWIELDYGVVVWRPTIIRVDWSPYNDGRWIWTTDGWYWNSYEPFGYITYHYGRWYFDDYYGWLWYPDYEWAPAWVEWRYDDDYIGWAPLHPYALFSVSIGIHFTTTYYTPYYHWHFVGYNHFYDPHVYNYCVGPRYRYRIYSNTRYRTNYSYHNGRVRNYGVDVEIVRRRTSYDIRQRNIESVSDPRSLDNGRTNGNGNVRTIYKSRDELVRNEVRDIKFERSDRKSSLDVSRLKRNDVTTRDNNTSVDRNRNNTVDKRGTGNDSFNKRNQTNTGNDKNIQRFGDRNKSGNELNRNNVNRNTNKTLERNINKRNQTNETKRNTSNNNNVRKNNTQQNREIKVNRNNQQKNNTRVNQNNTQKRQEVKINRNNTQKKNEVRKNNNTTRQRNEIKVNRNKSGDRNKTKKR